MKLHNIDIAREMLLAGEVVAIPTETVYGLAALINNPEAIKKIFTTKERPYFDPLIVHVASTEQAKSLSLDWSSIHDKLAEAFWPGPLTIITTKNPALVSDIITSGLTTVGVRCPNHPMTLELINKLGCPLAAPSANKFTKTSPTTADHVIENFDNDIAVLEGDSCRIGVESTIVEIDEINQLVKILRPGMITHSQIEKVLPHPYQVIFDQTSQTPGNMKTHYAPKIPFYFVTDEKPLADQLLPEHEHFSAVEFKLDREAQIAARELYSKLQEIAGDNTLYYFHYQDYHKEVLWLAVIDRLKKAGSY